MNGMDFQNEEKSYRYENRMGCCADSLDVLIQRLASFPITQSFLPPAVFASDPDSCVLATSLPFVQTTLSYLAKENEVVHDQVQAFVQDLCLHFANGYTPCTNANPGMCMPVV